MVACHFIQSNVGQQLDCTLRPTVPEHSIAPRWYPLLLARVPLVGTRLKLVRRYKVNLSLGIVSQSMCCIGAPLAKQLVSLSKRIELASTDLGKAHLSRGIDSVVEVTGEEADLVIVHHGAIASANVRVTHVSCRRERRSDALLEIDAVENVDEIRVSLSNMLLPCCEVTIDKCEAAKCMQSW